MATDSPQIPQAGALTAETVGLFPWLWLDHSSPVSLALSGPLAVARKQET